LILVGWTLNASGQTLTTLWSFGRATIPIGELLQGADGNLYGATAGGGSGHVGGIFRLTPSGSFTNLFFFSRSVDPDSFSRPDGGLPCGLVQGKDGCLYGTTYYGGPRDSGTVFRLSTNGSFTNLWSFTGGDDGGTPRCRLVQGVDGNFYGTTLGGGVNGSGTVFRITPSGTLTNLHSFNGSDGACPAAGLVQGTDGNLYGTTLFGGASDRCQCGCGTVFRISPNGRFTTLHSFDGDDDGEAPETALVQGTDGNFYGTTLLGGASSNGTVFRVSSNGSFTNLWSFTGGADGGMPKAPLIQARDGNFYGTTEGQNIMTPGNIFRISPNGRLTNLYTFLSSTNGVVRLDAGLMQGKDGCFYGTTHAIRGNDIIFKLAVPSE